MAFVNRSERKLETDLLSPTNIGPGEYSNNEAKEQARFLHKISNIFTHRTKLTPLETKVAFNSTGGKGSDIFKTNSNPGPGSYLNILTEKCIKDKLPLLTNKDEIVFVEENHNLVPKIKSEKNGFLSSEKRFFEKVDLNKYNYYQNTEPNLSKNNIRFNSVFNKNKIHNNRYGKIGINNNKNIKNLRNLYANANNNSIPTIPDKSRGDFKMINGKLEEIKKTFDISSKKEEEELGPGKYNVIPKFHPKSINWNYGFNKIPKNIIYKNELISNFKEHKNINKLNHSMKISNKILKKSISNSDILDNINTQNLIHNKNNSMRNQVFIRYIKDREKIITEQMNKQKEYNEKINHLQSKETPGPGFYTNKIHPTIIFNTNKTQNFGSGTPKFSNLELEKKEILGPGYYFLEKNKYEPKIEVAIHIKKPNKKKYVKNNEGLYINNFRMKNQYRYPEVGQYNLGKDFIKGEISNVKSFGILSQRFKNLNLKNEDEYNDNNTQRELYQKINYGYEDKIKYKINQKFLEIKKKEEIYQKKRRDKFMNKKSPAVGDYSPEFSTSISYHVQSRINKFRDKVAPFNIKDSRFSSDNKLFNDNDIPGPGNYNVADAYEALNNGIKNGYSNNEAKMNNLEGIKNNNEKIATPGPGLYNIDMTSSWNKKSFNILFMNK